MKARAANIAVLSLIAVGGLGCWEQVSPGWFAQMKDQPAVQALEDVQPLDPPADTIPFGGIEPRLEPYTALVAPETMALMNPVKASTASVERGEELYGIYCSVCHGTDGAMLNATVGPRVGAIPLVGIVPTRSDGQLFMKIRYGKPVMPGYPQIPSQDRWHIVNYLRKLIPGS